MNFIISKELAEKILNYLVSKPYGEVFQIIGEMQTLKVAGEAQTVEESKKVK